MWGPHVSETIFFTSKLNILGFIFGAFDIFIILVIKSLLKCKHIFVLGIWIQTQETNLRHSARLGK